MYFFKLYKVNGVVIINKSEYIEKMNNILCDNTKFRQNVKDIFELIISLKDKVTQFLRYLKNSNVIVPNTFNILTLFGSKVGILMVYLRYIKPVIICDSYCPP